MSRLSHARSMRRFALSIWLAATLVLIAGLARCHQVGEALGSAAPPTQPGWYWCSTDPDTPVWVWNDGTADEPNWMVHHQVGGSDNYHATKYCACRWSPRLSADEAWWPSPDDHNPLKAGPRVQSLP